MGAMTLTLLAPGSADPRHARDVAGLSGRLKVAGIASQVAYLDKHEPSPAQAAQALASDGAPTTTVVPLLVSPAYHARVDVPVAVRQMQQAAPDVATSLAEPVGLHPLILDACAELVGSADLPIDDRTGIIVATTGSRDLRAIAMMEDLIRRHGARIVERLGARSVRAAYLDGGRPMGCIRTLLTHVDGCRSFVVVTAVIADGTRRDRIVESADRHELPVVPGSLAGTNALADLVIARAGSAPVPLPAGRMPATR